MSNAKFPEIIIYPNGTIWCFWNYPKEGEEWYNEWMELLSQTLVLV
jgi:hypothetical protein